RCLRAPRSRIAKRGSCGSPAGRRCGTRGRRAVEPYGEENVPQILVLIVIGGVEWVVVFERAGDRIERSRNGSAGTIVSPRIDSGNRQGGVRKISRGRVIDERCGRSRDGGRFRLFAGISTVDGRGRRFCEAARQPTAVVRSGAVLAMENSRC